MNTKIAFLGLLGVFVSICPHIASGDQNTWPVKKFKVVQQNLEPVSRTVDMLISGLPYSRDFITLDQEVAIEAWLEKVAEHFEDSGFPPPRYEKLADDGKAFAVYVYPFQDPDSPPAAAYNDCDAPESETFIKIDPKIFENGKLDTKGYQDIAHELFHTVQYSYPMFQGNCGQGAWILEGTAEAVGIETARKLLNEKPYTLCQAGLRPYSNKLYTYRSGVLYDQPCKLQRAYQTQSFWQFLGEYISSEGRPNPLQFKPPDYSYLHDFFNTKHNSSNWKDEYDWLNRALRDKFGFGLSRAYPSFVGTYSAYWKKRILDYPKPGGTSTQDWGDDEARKKKWHKAVFEGCNEIPLTNSTTPRTLQLNELEPVSAQCVDLEFQFTGQANFTIIAESTGRSLLDLAITAEDSEKRVQPIVHPDEFQPERVSFKFSLPVKPGDKKVYIISNIANVPQNSVKQKPIIKVVFDTASSSITDPDKAPPPPDAPNGSGVKKTKLQIELGYKTQSWRVSASQRGGDSGQCTQHFKDRVCGPYTQITLNLAPNTANILNEVANPGMFFERMLNVTGGIVERGEENVPTDVIAAVRKVQNKDGHTIKLKIPRITYGFTGSFDNALITAAKAYDGIGRAPGPYKSIGPGRVGGCDNGYYPFKGQVSIEEASRLVLRGTYTAALVDLEDVSTGCLSALPVAKNITGTFSMPNPRLDDSNNSVQLSEDTLDSVIQSTNEMIPGLVSDDMADYIRNKIQQNESQEGRQQASQQSGKKVSGFDKCKCSCEMEANVCFSNPIAECCEVCEPIVNMCKGNRKTHQAALTPEEQVQMDAENRAMRQQYEAYVDSFAPNVAVKKQMMNAFDALKTIDEKKVFMMAIPQKIH